MIAKSYTIQKFNADETQISNLLRERDERLKNSNEETKITFTQQQSGMDYKIDKHSCEWFSRVREKKTCIGAVSPKRSS
jgi:hypothetical protein